MSLMAKFDRKNRLQTDSTFEIKDVYESAVTELNRSDEFRARVGRLFHGTFLNALALWFAQQEIGDRERIASEGIALLKESLGGEIEEPGQPEAPAQPIASPAKLIVKGAKPNKGAKGAR